MASRRSSIDPRAVIRRARLHADVHLRALDLSNFGGLDELGDEEEWDEDSRALLEAMAEWDRRDHASRAKWTPAQAAQHPRGPSGRFRTVLARVQAALTAWQKAGGKGDPFKGFNREQLRKVALQRGIVLRRGEDRDSIANKLLADLTTKTPASKAGAPTPAAGTPTVKTKPTQWSNGDPAVLVDINGANGGIVVHDTRTGGYFPFITANTQKTPLGNTVKVKPGVGNGYQTEQAAVDAIVQAHTPSKVSGPGLAGLKLTELRVDGRRGMFGSARRSWEVSESGKPIGTVHDFGYAFVADDTTGLPLNNNFNSKSAALQALAGHAGISASAKTPAALVLPQGGKHAPEIQGALDILYGKDPKGNTISRQLAVYGSLRRHQFDQLGTAEQQGVLADLAYIETNSKSNASASQASKIIDRFTPPGTAPGTAPKPSAQIVGPANGTQTRLPTPRTGLLKTAANSGVRGDNWMSPASGSGGRVWGEYGAGGLLLRHVDNKGVERFLLTQRGPAISDPGKWSYPGGAFESKEDFYQGSTREFAEELGFTDADFTGSTVHGYHVFERPDVKTKMGQAWTYHSVAATVPTMLKPNLSTHGAKAETSDAKWLTRAEIEDLDRKGLLHAPVAGGKLQRNVMSLFDSAKPAVVRPGPQNVRPKRLTGTPTVHPPTVKTHKPSLGSNLVADKAARDKLRQDIKNARRSYAGKAADDRLAAIGAMQGFDDVPTVVTKAEFDDLLKSGDYIQVWRGVRGKGVSSGPTRGGQVTSTKTAAQIHEEFRSGPAYYGIGMYGNGYYFSTDRSLAAGYSDHNKGSLLTALIPKKANIVEHRTIEAEAKANSSPYSKAKGKSHEPATLWDEGRYAAAKGHDMIKIPPGHVSTAAGKPNYVVLNRSVMIVLEEQ